MSTPLNVIALISGGKDSLFSMLHCIQHGHNIVALANLHPPLTLRCQSATAPQAEIQSHHEPGEVSDMNSFMYQTVGHSIIPLYATVLQFPLYRHPISGTSTQQTQYYDTSSDQPLEKDETEDLVPLLRKVLNEHPEANAISTGAILSTYQRTRIESIALRLGLIPLAFLWQFPVLPPPLTTNQKSRPDSLTALLDDMAVAGLDARVIKIASAGMPESLLFSNVTDPRSRSQLIRGLTPFFDGDELGLRAAVLGEGGEYETLALNGPKKIWRGGRIEINDDAMETYTEDGVSYVRLERAKVVPHESEARQIIRVDDSQTNNDEKLVRIPGIFDAQFSSVKVRLQTRFPIINRRQDVIQPTELSIAQDDSPGQSSFGSQTEIHRNIEPESAQNQLEPPHLLPSRLFVALNEGSQTIAISNITSTSITAYIEAQLGVQADDVLPSASQSASQSASDQLTIIVTKLPHLFSLISNTGCITSNDALPLGWSNIATASLLLSSIADFLNINAVYCRIWPSGLPNPPARVTISVPLPQDVHVCLNLIFDLSPPRLRRGLHVQGRSYWAPANIGPYSQAIAVPVHLDITRDGEGHPEESHPTFEVVHMAGQIPLLPSSMNLLVGSFLESALLSLQHLWRVGQERGVDVWPWGIAFISQCNGSYIDVIRQVWSEVHVNSSTTRTGLDAETEDEDDDVVDIWDQQHNRALNSGPGVSSMTVGKHLHPLPNYEIPGLGGDAHVIPPFIAAEVLALPKNANVEWWSTGIAGLARLSSARIRWSDTTLEHGSLSCLTIAPNNAKPQRTVKFITYFVNATATESASMGMNKMPSSPSQIVEQLDGGVSTATKIQLVQGTAFASQCLPGHESQNGHSTSSHMQINRRLPLSLQQLTDSVAVIPCTKVWAHASCDSRAAKTSRNDFKENATQRVSAGGQVLVAFALRIDVSA